MPDLGIKPGLHMNQTVYSWLCHPTCPIASCQLSQSKVHSLIVFTFLFYSDAIKINPGSIFAIYSKEIHSEGLWYRVKVLKVKGDKVQIEYMDYGDTGTVATSSLRSIPPRFLELPFQVCGLKSFRLEILSKWSLHVVWYWLAGQTLQYPIKEPCTDSPFCTKIELQGWVVQSTIISMNFYFSFLTFQWTFIMLKTKKIQIKLVSNNSKTQQKINNLNSCRQRKLNPRSIINLG